MARSLEGLAPSQQKYTLDMLEECGLQGTRPNFFPIEQTVKFSIGGDTPEVDPG